MKKLNWGDLAEIVGHVAIVASLIFVGLQLMQSQDIAIATQYQERAAAAVEYNGSQMSNALAIAEKGAEIVEFASTSTASPELKSFIEGRSRESIGMWFYENRVFFTMIDNFHYQYSNGFMEQESWDAFAQELRKQLIKDSVVAYYKHFALSPRGSFKELCDQILEEAN